MMAAANGALDYRAELAQDYAHWFGVYEHGGSDPLYADGVNLSLIKTHIQIDKRRIEEHSRLFLYLRNKTQYPL